MAQGIGLALAPGGIEPAVFLALADSEKEAAGLAFEVNAARREAALLAKEGFE